METEVSAQNIVAQQSHFLGLPHGHLKAVDGQRIFRAHIHIAFGCAHGPRADEHAFQHGMGVAFQHGAIHERAGVAFVRVAAHVFGAAFGHAGELPLSSGGEARAAPSAQTGSLHFLKGFFGAHFQGFGQPFISAAGDIFLNVFGVDASAVAQHQTVLQTVERHFLVGLARRLAGASLEEQAFHQLAFHDGFCDDFLAVLGLYAHIEIAAGVDDDQGAEFAEAVTAGGDDFAGMIQTVLFERLLKGRPHGLAARRGAARASAHENLEFFVRRLTVITTQNDFMLGAFPDLPEVGGGSKTSVFGHGNLSCDGNSFLLKVFLRP